MNQKNKNAPIHIFNFSDCEAIRLVGSRLNVFIHKQAEEELTVTGDEISKELLKISTTPFPWKTPLPANTN